MLTYNDILFATTKLLDEKFNCDVIVDDLDQNFENECFYVTLVPTENVGVTKTYNKKILIISIKYINDLNRLALYSMANSLEQIFVRKLKVNKRFLEISSTEPTFITDEVGAMLDFLVTLEFTDIDIIADSQDQYELMGTIETSLNREIKE